MSRKVVPCLLKRFWRSFIGLVLFLLVVDVLSWIYIVTHLTLQVAPTGILGRLVLPTEAPSIWNLIQPGNTKDWLPPFVVLIVQVWLTGGFYGTLIRANTNEQVNTATFIVDGSRTFVKLLLWNLLWAAVSMVVLGVSRGLPAFAPGLGILVLLLRFAFMFGDIALVAEKDPRYALKLAPSLLIQQWLVMLPLAIVIIVLTDLGRWLSGSTSSGLLVVVAGVYSIAVAWTLHMVVARYLYFSKWMERSARA